MVMPQQSFRGQKQPSISLAAALKGAITAKAERPPAVPHRLVETTINGLTFSATFDSGNLARIEPDESGDGFIAWSRADCDGMEHKRRTRTWFFFSVCGAAPGRVLQIEVRMSDQSKLFSHDMRPVYCSLPSQPSWQRLQQPSPRNNSPSSDGFGIHLRHTVDAASAGETLYFAFCFPHSYSECMAQLAWVDTLMRQPAAPLSPEDASSYWQQVKDALAAGTTPDASVATAASPASSESTPKPVTPDQMDALRRGRLLDAAIKAAMEASVPPTAETSLATDEPPSATAVAGAAGQLATAAAHRVASWLPIELSGSSIYYRRELLTRSIEGRRVDLLTITGTNQQLGSLEPSLPSPLLPEGGLRPHRFRNKRMVLVSSRVHPGETPASHVLEGLLELLLRPNDPRAIALRERFVFKIIPMLNPDGVWHGHYRFDSRGVNLNRCYVDAAPDLHPSTHAALAVATQSHAAGELLLTIDLHAHAGRRGCFFYGNRLDEHREQVAAALYARLVALNTRWVDYDGCTWFDAGAHEGSARAAIYQATGLTHTYTLECNYDSGVGVNELPARHGSGSARCMSPEPPPTRTLSPKYTPSAWQEVGRALGLAVLDMGEANPHSRLGAPGGEGLAKMRAAVAAGLEKSWAAMASRRGGGKLKQHEEDEEGGDSGGDEDEEEA